MSERISKMVFDNQICVFTLRDGFAILLVSTKNTERRLTMIRREKGFKRYAKQRERAFTDPLIREDEPKQVEERRARMARVYKEECKDGKTTIKTFCCD